MVRNDFLIPPKARPGLRRVSSTTATENELTSGGPVVVVPERMLRQRSQSHNGFAASMETARNELAAMNLEEEALTSPESTSPETPGTPLTPADLPAADSLRPRAS